MKRTLIGFVTLFTTLRIFAGTANITVQADQPGHAIPESLWGIFFEEINSGGDGGLYAELVRNRSFEEPIHTNRWQPVISGGAVGQMTADNSQPQGASNAWALCVTQSSVAGSVGAANTGWWGMNLQAGRTYDLAVQVRCSVGFSGGLTVRLENATGSQVLAQANIGGLTTGWQRFTVALVPSATQTNGRLVLAISQPGSVWVDMVSLFPRDTFCSRTNGMRPDLGAMLNGLRPGFMRFPGGCWVEGEWMTNAYRWKQTIGDPANRATIWNLWQYYSPNGLGYHEYLQLCEDLATDALFVVNCGMSHNETVPLPQLGEYVQDALDAIEYANGPTNSTWGALRSANGHPAPFNLKYVQVGNENGGTAYNDRYALFYDAITNAHPDIKIIACNWGGLPTLRPVQISDEHYYNNPAFFSDNAGKYDNYNRSGPKIYVGEFAVTSGTGNGSLRGAVAEAAFMTGIERNSDIVTMASYAPLFAHVNNKVWNPDLIYFDSSRVCGTPSYYVQQMFAQNRGDVLLPVALSVSLDPETNTPPRGAIGLGSWNTSVQYSNIVVTSNGVTLYQSDFNAGASGWQVYGGTWSTAGGVYQQTAITTDCRSTTGNTNWAGYTITLRARKVSGNEGFLILFNWRDDANFTWWNLGGWNNTLHAIEQSQDGAKRIIGSQVAGTIEADRWYDIRIELSGEQIRCYLDDVLVHDTAYPAAKKGAVGLGTWSTSASFTNVAVTRAGQTLYQSDFTSGAAGWTVYRGTWSTQSGRYRQTSTSTTDCRSTTGNTNWSDCTLTLKARKDGGSEGFLILFNWLDDNNWTWWNIGGWNNTRHAIEVCENGNKSTLGNGVDGTITTGQWYDIRVELAGTRIRCYLDDVLVHEVSYGGTGSLFATASFHEASGQIILKAANTTRQSVTGSIQLAGLTGLGPTATALCLTSGSPTDENTLSLPEKVSPVSATLNDAGTNFSHDFPPYSLTVLRLQTPPTLPAKVGLEATTNQNNLATFPEGVPVRLSSFITNAVSVDYVIEGSGGLVSTGTVHFVPGELVRHIALPAWALQPGALIRLSLVNPVNAQIEGVTGAWFLQPPASDNPPRLGFARMDSGDWLYWQNPAALLQQSTNLNSNWGDLVPAFSPYAPGTNGLSRFFRLRLPQ